MTKTIKLKNKKWNRILKLADFMEKLPRRRFNFGHWVSSKWQGKPDLSCGTTACALGWATTMPLFRRLGMRLSKERHEPTLNGVPVNKMICGRTVGLTRFAVIFGVTKETIDNLFVPTDYPELSVGLGASATPKQWAKHARNIVKQLQAGKTQ